MQSLLPLRYLTPCLGLLLLIACGSDDCPAVKTVWPDDLPNDAIRVSLAAVCGSEGCPVDKKSAVLRVQRDIAMEEYCPTAAVLSGCGVDEVEESFGTHGSAWYYDQKSGNLIAAESFDDVSYSRDGCSTLAFYAGELIPRCKHVTTQSLCRTSSDGNGNDAGTAASTDAGSAARGGASIDASTDSDAGK